MELLPQIKYQLVFDERIDGAQIKALRAAHSADLKDEVDDQGEEYEGDRCGSEEEDEESGGDIAD